jgi:hypothetical protein
LAFHHDVTDAWDIYSFTNVGKIRRSGGELNIETLPWQQLTFKAVISATSEDGIDYDNEEMYGANLTLLYDDPKHCRVKLNGRYVWWNKFVKNTEWDPKHDNFVWDLVVDREILARNNFRAEVFISVHNLFNATQRWDIDYPIPQRWLEGGVTFRF